MLCISSITLASCKGKKKIMEAAFENEKHLLERQVTPECTIDMDASLVRGKQKFTLKLVPWI